MTLPFTSGQKVSAALLNSVFTDILSEAWTTRDIQTAANTGFTNTTFTTPTNSCVASVTSTGTFALIAISALLNATAAGVLTRGSFAVSGATTISASTNTSNNLFIENTTTSILKCTDIGIITITPGLNTYTMQYLTGGTSTIASQSILVIAP
jgi:hypothetical protein